MHFHHGWSDPTLITCWLIIPWFDILLIFYVLYVLITGITSGLHNHTTSVDVLRLPYSTVISGPYFTIAVLWFTHRTASQIQIGVKNIVISIYRLLILLILWNRLRLRTQKVTFRLIRQIYTSFHLILFTKVLFIAINIWRRELACSDFHHFWLPTYISYVLLIVDYKSVADRIYRCYGKSL